MRAASIALTALLLAGCRTPSARDAALRPIVLVTDYGTKDFYVGALKGSICAIHPGARVYDATHDVAAFDVAEGAYTLSRMAPLWPEGTIFVVIVDPGVGTSRRGVAVRTRAGHTYVGPDNGLFTYVVEKEGFDAARELTDARFWREGTKSTTFHGRDIFGPVAAHLSKGTRVEELGAEAKDLTRLPIHPSSIEVDVLRTQVIHVDTYGNLGTNAPAELLAKLGAKEGSTLDVEIAGKKTAFPWGATYGAVPEGKPVLVIDSDGDVELAINMGNLAQAQGVKAGAEVTLRLRR